MGVPEAAASSKEQPVSAASKDLPGPSLTAPPAHGTGSLMPPSAACVSHWKALWLRSAEVPLPPIPNPLGCSKTSGIPLCNELDSEKTVSGSQGTSVHIVG